MVSVRSNAQQETFTQQTCSNYIAAKMFSASKLFQFTSNVFEAPERQQSYLNIYATETAAKTVSAFEELSYSFMHNP